MGINMISEKTMDAFLEELSSSSPVPGGGGVSAYAAAAGMALGLMVANLTTGKKKYQQYQQEIDVMLVDMNKRMESFKEYIDKDAQVFEPLSKAYGLPKTTQEEINLRNEVLEKNLFNAAQVPLELMQAVYDAMAKMERMAVIGSRLAISDIGVGIQMLKAALNGASFNVYINTKLMKNITIADDMNAKADRLIADGNALADRINSAVMELVR